LFEKVVFRQFAINFRL